MHTFPKHAVARPIRCARRVRVPLPSGWLPRALRAMMILVTLSALLVGSLCAVVAQEVRRPSDADDPQVYTVEVPAGTTVAEVAADLARYGLILHPALFRYIAQAQQVDRVAPGTYRLRKSMSMAELVAILQARPQDDTPTTGEPPTQHP